MKLDPEVLEVMLWVRSCFSVLPHELRSMFLAVISLSLIISLFGLFRSDG